jgi:hypothetical protein
MQQVSDKDCERETDTKKEVCKGMESCPIVFRMMSWCTRYGPEFNSACCYTIIFAPSAVDAGITLIVFIGTQTVSTVGVPTNSLTSPSIQVEQDLDILQQIRKFREMV